MNEDFYESVAGVSVPALVRLAEPATALPVLARRIRAHHGGAYMSAFKGRGMEFDEVRPYQPGDDVRSIDWKVTARTGEPFTKQFREERERPVLLCVDFRLPMFFATRGAFKSVVACYGATLLAWSASRAGDRVGGLLFGDRQHQEIKPQRGKAAVLHLIKQLAAHPGWGQRAVFKRDPAALGHALGRLRRVARPGSLVFLISDFRDLDTNGESQILGISRHNDVVLLFVNDPLERSLPPAGRYRLTDGNEQLEVDTANPSAGGVYAERFQARHSRLEELTKRSRVRLIDVSTDSDLLDILKMGLRRHQRLSQ